MSSKRGYSGTGDRADLNNHSSQCNPNNSEYRGYRSGYRGDGTKADRDNHGNQLNPNNRKYRGRDHLDGGNKSTEEKASGYYFCQLL